MNDTSALTYDNVAGNHSDKYGSSNPIVRNIMNGFMSNFDSLVRRAAPKTAFEIGCGEGHLSMRLSEAGIDVCGCDIDQGVVNEANYTSNDKGYGNCFTTGSIYDLKHGEIEADLIVCCEVLEHLPDPEAALDILAAQDADYWLMSVPREPMWRILNMMRGKYIGELGNTPGHLQHWSSRTFQQAVERRWNIIELKRPVPWTMVLCSRLQS